MEGLAREKALREGGDEADLDEEAEDCFDGCQNGDGIAQALHRLEEAARFSSPGEKALREGSDEGNLNQQTEECLRSRIPVDEAPELLHLCSR